MTGSMTCPECGSESVRITDGFYACIEDGCGLTFTIGAVR